MMSDESQVGDEMQEGEGNPVVDSDNVDDQYELNDVVEIDYYATDDDETDEETA